MGRELKRVALDFKWPEDKVWEGYLNPHYEKCHQCRECNGTGTTTAHQRLSDLISMLMLSSSDVMQGKCHPYFAQAPLYQTQGLVCGKDMLELTQALAGREVSFLGHDASDKWRAVTTVIKAAGLSEDWGICPNCQGEGSLWESEQDKQNAENWEKIEPPAGEGYQIWETVSEGSPISPVFDTPEKLAQYMSTTKWGADPGTSYESWMRFIKGPGWSVSMVMDSNGLRSGHAV
jgi:hypothetical protein